MRIGSLLPAATEILYALGLGESIVGVSRECDYPPAAARKPKLIRTLIDQESRSSEEIDGEVRRAQRQGESLYRIDLEALQEAHPDLLLTQGLCEVCAVNASQLSQALQALSHRPRIVSLHAHTLDGVLEEIRLLGSATGREAQAEALMRAAQERLRRVRELVANAPAPTVCCIEWLNPLMSVGHWVPEMVAQAGGREVLGQAGEASRYVRAEELVAADPEVLILMPCGFSIERTRRELPLLSDQLWWSALAAVRAGRVYLADGSSYFSRPGPRLVEGIELLAAILHPDRCTKTTPFGASEPLAQTPPIV